MKRVLFIMQWYNNETHKGIATYAGEHGWHLNAKIMLDGQVPKDWDGEGIITSVPGMNSPIQHLLNTTSAQVVYLSSQSDGIYHPSLCLNHTKVSTLAADYLTTKGYKRFICYYDNGSLPSCIRVNRFSEIIEDGGGTVTPIEMSEDWIQRVNHLKEVLANQTFPIAVFVAEDDNVSDVTEACAHEGIRIPEDVAILSVNNDETLCLACGVPVSSIDSNLRKLGYEAAALLDRHMADPHLPAEHHVMVHSPHVVTRRSTDTLAVDHPGVAQALHFINANYTQPIKIADIVKSASISRAGLFNAFRDELGRTPAQEIARLRMEYAKRYLLESAESMDSIAYDAGFQTAQNMYVVFKKHLGVSPSEFRKCGGS